MTEDEVTQKNLKRVDLPELVERIRSGQGLAENEVVSDIEVMFAFMLSKSEFKVVTL